MDPKKYLENRLRSCSLYELTDTDKKLLDQGIEEYIYAKLTSKKFRKWKVDESTEQKVKSTIHLNISKNEPIHFTFPFGGYKLWRLPNSPEVDWAEFFTFAYYSEYVAPVVAAYKPGVEFWFSSDDLVVGRMDNIPKADTDAYVASFRKFLTYFQKYFPENMKMELKQVSEFYPDIEEFNKEINANLEKQIADYKSGAVNVDSMLTMSELNIKFDGDEDWTTLSDEEKKWKITLGALLHHAYSGTSKKKAFVRGENKIVIFPTPIPNSLAIGTTKTSVTKFWTGVGVLEKNGDDFRDRILSPKQWEEFKEVPVDTVKVDLIDMKNFKEIQIFEAFDFKK